MKKVEKTPNYERNIKVTMNEDVDGISRRTSTTLDYGICSYYFGDLMHPEDALKASKDKRFKDPKLKYRTWLEGVVRAWAKTQPKADNRALERTLLTLIFSEGHQRGVAANKDNHGLDV